MTFQPLIAADLFQTIVGALFVILWLASHFLGSRQEAKGKKQPPRPRPQQPRQVNMAEGAAGPQNQGPRNQEEALRSEVEDFLRRAQGKPQLQQPAQQPEPTRQVQPPRPKPQRKKPVASLETRTLRSEGVAEHVTRHLSTQDIAEHTKTLGAEVATSDDRLESHLLEKFDQKLGKLAHRDAPDEIKQPENNVADEIAAMLRTPAGVRQLIVANEILRRPEW